jgi:hypothetical protein
MATYIYKQCSRSLWSLIGAIVVAAFGCISWFLVFTSDIGFGGVVLAVLFTFSLLYFIYFYIHPVTWSVKLIDDRLSWYSPHFPSQTRDISVSEIVGVSVTGGEPEKVVLRLSSGETVSIPPPCVGRDPERLIQALIESNSLINR